MGHYCRICGRSRPNEKFSGRGHHIHICRQCAKLPKSKRDAILQRQEMEGFLRQSHISNKNIARLGVLATSDNPEIVMLAQLVLEVDKIKPYKQKRFTVLAKKRPDLLHKLSESGLIAPFHFIPWSLSEDDPDDWDGGGFENFEPLDVYEPFPEEEPIDWYADNDTDCVEVCEPPPEETEPEDWDIDMFKKGYSSEFF